MKNYTLRFDIFILNVNVTLGRYDSEREAVLSITAEIEKQLDDNTYNAPNFHELRIALVAARLYCPLGTRLTFSEYAV